MTIFGWSLWEWAGAVVRDYGWDGFVAFAVVLGTFLVHIGSSFIAIIVGRLSDRRRER